MPKLMNLQDSSSETMSVKQFLAEGRQNEKIELTDEQVKSIIPHLGLDNDVIFCITMQDKKLAELIARDILEDPGAEVKDIYAHDAYSFSSKREGSLIDNELDIVIETSAGEIVDLELQCSADKRGPIEDRVLAYASNCILKWQVGKNNTKYKFNRTVVCFLCGYDWCKDAPADEHIHLTRDSSGSIFTQNLSIRMICYEKFEKLTQEALQGLCSVLAKHPNRSEVAKYVSKIVDTVKGRKELVQMVRLTDLDEYVAKENEKVKQKEREDAYRFLYENMYLTGKMTKDDLLKFLHRE